MNSKKINFTLNADNVEVTGLSLVNGKLELKISASIDTGLLGQELLAQLTEQANTVQEAHHQSQHKITAAIPLPSDEQALPKPQQDIKPAEQKRDSLINTATDSEADYQAQYTSNTVIEEQPSTPKADKSSTELQSSSRYGEPEENIEWSVFLGGPQDTSDNKSEENTDYNLSKKPMVETEEPSKNCDETEKEPVSTQENILQTESEQSFKTPEPETTEKTDPESELENEPDCNDSVPQLTSAESDTIPVFTPDNISKMEIQSPDIEDSGDKNGTESFFKELSPAINNDPINDLPPEITDSEQSPETQSASDSQPDTEQIVEEPAPKTKARIKYTCPKCHTTGHQDIDRVGSIITCENCGRAMRLTLRK